MRLFSLLLFVASSAHAAVSYQIKINAGPTATPAALGSFPQGAFVPLSATVAVDDVQVVNYIINQVKAHFSPKCSTSCVGVENAPATLNYGVPMSTAVVRKITSTTVGTVTSTSTQDTNYTFTGNIPMACTQSGKYDYCASDARSVSCIFQGTKPCPTTYTCTASGPAPTSVTCVLNNPTNCSPINPSPTLSMSSCLTKGAVDVSPSGCDQPAKTPSSCAVSYPSGGTPAVATKQTTNIN